MFEARESLEEFEALIPPHECDKNECSHPGGMYIFITDDDSGSVALSSGTHRLEPTVLVQALVEIIDRGFLASKPDDMPGVIAHTHGRELIKRAVEEIPPPAGVSQDLDSVVADFMRHIMEGHDDE